jgi:hypothetical protein
MKRFRGDTSCQSLIIMKTGATAKVGVQDQYCNYLQLDGSKIGLSRSIAVDASKRTMRTMADLSPDSFTPLELKIARDWLQQIATAHWELL